MYLKLYGNDVNNVFALNRDDENSATFAFGWALSRSPALFRATIDDLAEIDIGPEQALIEVQKHGEEKGFTDMR